jgi:hypothetical protein
MGSTLTNPVSFDLKSFKVTGPQEVQPDGAPTVSNAYLADLMTRQIQLLEEQNRLLRKQHSEWIDADEAAELLGKRINESGTHRRVLTYCRKKGFLKTFGQTHPYTYLRKDVLDIVDRMKTGLVLP